MILSFCEITSRKTAADKVRSEKTDTFNMQKQLMVFTTRHGRCNKPLPGSLSAVQVLVGNLIPIKHIIPFNFQRTL